MYAQVENQPGSVQAFSQDGEGMEDPIRPAAATISVTRLASASVSCARAGRRSVHKSDVGRIDQLLPINRQVSARTNQWHE